MAVKLHEFLPHKSIKQLREKRREAVYKRLLSEAMMNSDTPVESDDISILNMAFIDEEEDNDNQEHLSNNELPLSHINTNIDTEPPRSDDLTRPLSPFDTFIENSGLSENWGSEMANLVKAEIQALDHQGPAKDTINSIQAQLIYGDNGRPQKAVDCAY